MILYELNITEENEFWKKNHLKYVIIIKKMTVEVDNIQIRPRDLNKHININFYGL